MGGQVLTCRRSHVQSTAPRRKKRKERGGRREERKKMIPHDSLTALRRNERTRSSSLYNNLDKYIHAFLVIIRMNVLLGL